MTSDDSVENIIDAGFALHEAGRWAEAEVAYRSALARAPNDCDLLNLLGLVTQQAGRSSEAIEFHRKAVAIDTDCADFRHNLAEAYRANGNLQEAISEFEAAIRIESTMAKSWRGLGIVFQSLGRFEQAIACWKKLLDADPNDSETLNNIAVALRHLGRSREAIGLLERAQALDPDSVLAARNLARAHFDLKQFAKATDAILQFAKAHPLDGEAHVAAAVAFNMAHDYDHAIEACQFALRIDPNLAEAHFNLGVAFDGIGETRGAALAYARTAELAPEKFAPHINLGLALLAVGELDRAAEAFSSGATIDPNSINVLFNLAIAYERAGKIDQAFETVAKIRKINPDWPMAMALNGTLHLRKGEHAEAEECFLAAVNDHPTFAAAWNNLATLYAERAEHDKCFDAMRKAMAAKPNFQTHDVLVFFMNTDPRFSPREVFEEHLNWDRRWGTPREQWPSFENVPDPARRIRIGYISPDFRAHSVAFFATSFLPRHDHNRFEVFCYDNTSKPDQITDQIRRFSDHWIRIVGQSTDLVYERIRRDEVDILIDLTGHTADNHMPVFARKAAPVQVSYLGYPNTTGLAAMDYRLTDALADPIGQTDALHSEELIRLPDTFLCYLPGGDAPPVKLPTPAAEAPAHRVTFGSFNALTKVTPQVIALWARVLHAVPGSRFCMKGNGLQQSQLRDLFVQRFASHGIDPSRLELLGRTVGFVDHMEKYAVIDIGLDPFPYHGTTTTCEALWMGVPVITLAGDTHVSRVGVSILTNVGLDSLIAHTPEAYVEIAVRLASDVHALNELRSSMRDRMSKSPLMAAATFTRNLEAAYLSMWSRWCQKSDQTPTLVESPR